jgi:hypothetical protein
MANTTINQLSSLAGASLADGDLFLIHNVSAGIEKQISAADVRTGMGIRPNVIDVSSSSHALRITQRGTGNAICVEDSTSPDVTPFIITNGGDLLVGHNALIQTDNDSGTLFTPKHQIHGTSEARSALGLYTWSTDTAGAPHIVFSKSTSGTIGARTVVTSGTDLGCIVFNGDDGVGFTIAAEILAEVDGTAGVGDMPGRIVFLTTRHGANTVTERMRITSSGSVGIATVSPQATLDVGGTSNATDRSIRVGGTGNVYGQLSVNTAAGVAQLTAGNVGAAGSALAINTAATNGNETERLRITSDGYVGIATSTPTQRLDVNDSSIRIRTANTPATAAATGSTGQIAWDSNYVYVCVATNTWKRAALSTW